MLRVHLAMLSNLLRLNVPDQFHAEILLGVALAAEWHLPLACFVEPLQEGLLLLLAVLNSELSERAHLSVHEGIT